MARFKMKLPDLPERNHLVWKGGSVLAEIMQVGGGGQGSPLIGGLRTHVCRPF